jgi:hypothetical protein
MSILGLQEASNVKREEHCILVFSRLSDAARSGLLGGSLA